MTASFDIPSTARSGAPASGGPGGALPPVLAQAATLRAAIAAAGAPAALAEAAAAIPRLADLAIDRAGGGDVGAITALISELNDEVTVRAVQLVAAETGADLERACWLAFGSQARGEQTLITDQDNGLVFEADDAERDRAAWLAFGERVNHLLADCGYPLCPGRVMAGQPPCCLTAGEWQRRFEHWMAHGSGNDLLAARIYFDLRPLAGNRALAAPLQALLRSPAASVPRFLKQMAEIVLCNHVPLTWWGGTRTARHEGRRVFDLKMSGTALFVDAARLWALAHATGQPGTVPRLRAAADALRVPARELDGWLDAFDALQRLRLQVQRRRRGEADIEQRCWADWDELDEEQRRTLNRSLRTARWLQQRIALDYRRT